MGVWLTIPSARPLQETAPVFAKWAKRGYMVFLWIDKHRGAYPGYAVAVNTLIREAMRIDPNIEWFVTGGDDTEPDPNHSADDIAMQCWSYFGGTYGVMQPTGDRFAQGSIDRIAGSAWIGREFAERSYGGHGPLWCEYEHMFVDEELQEVAIQQGVFWQRPDLVQLHRHFMRETDALDSRAVQRAVPRHLVKWNTQEHWDCSKAIFQKRKREGFPGSEPL